MENKDKIKIGDKEYILLDHNEIANEGKVRPYVRLVIDATYDEIYPLGQQENQTYFIIFGLNEEQKDLSNKCVIFGSCKNITNSTCELVMEDYSDIEYKDMTINDLLEV